MYSCIFLYSFLSVYVDRIPFHTSTDLAYTLIEAMCYFSGGIIEPCGLISCGSKIQHSTTYRPMVSSQEGNYVKEFALHHDHHVSRSTCGPRSEDVASIDDVMESEAAMLCRSNVAKTLVLESTAADVKNVPIECNEEMVHNTSVDDTVATAYYIKQSISDSSKERYSEEETGTNVDKDYDPQRTSQNADFTLTEGLPSKDVRTFVADDDRTSLDNSMFGILLHNRGNSKAIIARNSELADPRGDSDRPHKPQDHQLPYPIVTTNIGSLVKPVTCTGNCLVVSYEKVYLPIFKKAFVSLNLHSRFMKIEIRTESSR